MSTPATQLVNLKNFLGRYAEVYREKYSTPSGMHVQMNFLGNNQHLYFRELVAEPGMTIGEFWFNGTNIRFCKSDTPDAINGFLKTYEVVTATNWLNHFTTNLQFIGEHLDLGYNANDPAGSGGPGAVVSYLGAILASDGQTFNRVLAGPSGMILTSDPTAPEGVSWQDPAVIEDSDDDLTWQGAYNPSATYKKGDVVKYDDNTYVFTAGTPAVGINPPTVSHWDLFVPKGGTGLTGPAGLIGDTGDPAVTWKNVWDNGTLYNVDDAVVYGGSSYRALTPNQNSEPPSPYWEVFARGAESYVVTRVYTTISDVCENRVVVTDDAGLLMEANPNNVDHAYRIVGVSAHGANAGQECKVIMYGYMECPTWVFVPGRPIFVGNQGRLTQATPAGGFSAIIARPISSSAINIGTYECPILL